MFHFNYIHIYVYIHVYIMLLGMTLWWWWFQIDGRNIILTIAGLICGRMYGSLGLKASSQLFVCTLPSTEQFISSLTKEFISAVSWHCSKSILISLTIPSAKRNCYMPKSPHKIDFYPFYVLYLSGSLRGWQLGAFTWEEKSNVNWSI